MVLTRQGEPVVKKQAGAEQRIRRAMKDAGGSLYARIEMTDLDAVFEELHAQRARCAALFREMSRPLPGVEGD